MLDTPSDAENTSPERRRCVGRPYLSGRSGNPGGRPKALAAVMEAAKAHTAAAIETLAAIMADRRQPAAARIAAAVAILDRGWGKPRQPVGAEGLADLATALEAMRARRQQPH